MQFCKKMIVTCDMWRAAPDIYVGSSESLP